MAKEDAKVVITGDASGLFKTLGDSSAAVKGMAKEMEGAVGGLKNMLMGFAAPLAALAAVVGGKEFLKGTIDETKNWTVEAQKLSRVLNITTEAASVLNLAIGDIYGTQEEYLGAVAKLTRTLNTNEEAFHRLGVATRDQNGAFRDTPTIMAEVNAALLKIEGGTARNVASAQIYGKSWMEVQRYLKLTPEVMQAAQKKAEKLNLIVGSDAVEATKRYRESMNDLEDTVKALKIRLGKELMPLLTEFNNTASDQGPRALSALGIGVAIVSTQFQNFLFVMREGWAFLKMSVMEVANIAQTFASVTEKVQAGNLSGAAEEFRSGKERAKALFVEFLTEVDENANKLKKAVHDAWNGGPGDGNMGPQQDKDTKDPRDGDGKDGADPYDAFEARMKAEAALRKERLALWEQHQNDMFEVFGTELDREERKINQHHDAMLQHAKSFNAEQGILDQIETDREVALQNARTEAAAKESEKRRQIEREEAEERRRVLEATGTAQQGFLDGLDQYLQRQGSTFQQWAQATQQLLQGVESAFARSIQGILTGQMTLGQGLKAIWQGVSGAIVQMLAQMVAKWIVAAIAARIFKDSAAEAAQANAVAQQESAAATLWATYSPIPFAGPALAAGFIAMMNATLVANAASAKGIVGAAEGAWFDRPTLAMIGEGRRPELVVPDVAFKDFATNLSANILAQERQAQAYGRMASGYASSSQVGGEASPSVVHVSLAGAQIMDTSDRGLERLGNLVIDAVQVAGRRRGQVIIPGSAGTSF